MAMNGSQSGESDMILDSAATSHMFYDADHFTQYVPVVGKSIEVGDGRSLPIAGRGSITFKSRLPNGIRTVVLHGVHHVPQLQMNLISLSKLECKGASGSFGGGGIKVVVGKDELFRMTLLNGFYWIDRAVPGTGVAYVTSSSGSLHLWHWCMGHLHLDAIQQLARKDMVDGLTISSPQTFDHVCEGCVLGKSHRLPFPKASTTPYEEMELVVVDLTGPMSVETWTGMSFALVAVEASCRFGVGELLKSKDEAAEALKWVIVMLERQSGKLLRKIRTDNGTEWVNEIICQFCNRNGVIHQTAVPYGQEQNGLAEQTIAVYFEMVRCMLHSSGMDLRYWGEAFRYTVHIWNLSPTRGLDQKVPYHAWTN